jgi:hypothetical protein
MITFGNGSNDKIPILWWSTSIVNPTSMGKNLKRNSYVFHPFLIGIYPTLYLLSENIQEIRLSEGFRTLLLSLLSAILLLLLLQIILKNWQKAALVTSLLLFLFFSYGHIYLSLKGTSVIGIDLGRHRFLVPLWLCIAIVGIYVCIRLQESLRVATQVLNVISVAMIVMPLFGIFNYAIKSGFDLMSGSLEVRDKDNRIPGIIPNEKPDVYYIILDAYGRADILENYFSHDNEDFIEFLQDRGFYVTNQSYSNYIHSALSMASSLNMSFVDDLGIDLARADFPSSFRTRLSHSFVRTTFDRLGYSIVAIDSGWKWTQWLDADTFLTPDGDDRPIRLTSLSINPFEDLVLNTSGGRIMLDVLTKFAVFDAIELKDSADKHRQLILYELHSLEEVPQIPGPKFIFAHVVAPHRPYVFGPNGEHREPGGMFTFADSGDLSGEDLQRRLYRDQLIFITSELSEVISTILSQYDELPIIIIQADHGPRMGVEWEDPTDEDVEQGMAILNAYLLPERCRDFLEPKTSPVNSFRIVFNCSFGTDYEMLPNDSYFSGFEKILEFTRIDIEDH